MPFFKKRDRSFWNGNVTTFWHFFDKLNLPLTSRFKLLDWCEKFAFKWCLHYGVNRSKLGLFKHRKYFFVIQNALAYSDNRRSVNKPLRLVYTPYNNSPIYLSTSISNLKGVKKISHLKVWYLSSLRKDCFQNKSKFITENYFTKHMNITIRI